MGCIWSKLFPEHERIADDEDDEPPKQYSWDKRGTVDKSLFFAENLTDQVVERLPGTINGQQFIIQNCKNCDIYVFDHTATVSIDECTNCRIILGPIKTSVFVRDCTDCQLSLACQQFRTRDCKRLDVWLLCVTQPIIEASTAIHFGCLQLNYSGLAEQFNKSEINVYCNNWSHIHDFTPVLGETNYSYVSKDGSFEEWMREPPPSSREVSLAFDKESSAVPLTLGRRPSQSTERCLAVFFTDERLSNQPRLLIQALMKDSCDLSHTMYMTYDPTKHRAFQQETLAQLSLKGPLITLEFCGSQCVTLCQSALRRVLSSMDTAAHVSRSAEEATAELEELSGMSDMQMAV